jgi:hypothetical protein
MIAFYFMFKDSIAFLFSGQGPIIIFLILNSEIQPNNISAQLGSTNPSYQTHKKICAQLVSRQLVRLAGATKHTLSEFGKEIGKDVWRRDEKPKGRMPTTPGTCQHAIKNPSHRSSGNVRIGGFTRVRLVRAKSCLKISPGRACGESRLHCTAPSLSAVTALSCSINHSHHGCSAYAIASFTFLSGPWAVPADSGEHHRHH